jgi:dUTPase
VIDSIYRGEVFIDLHNISDKTIFISDRDFNQIRESILKEIDDVVDYLPEETVSHVRSWLARSENFIVINASKPITQVAIIPTMNWVPEETVELSESDRGDGCLGSTDK